MPSSRHPPWRRDSSKLASGKPGAVHTDGLGAMWQRSRAVLLRWLHLVQIGRALLVLLTAKAEPETLALVRLGGWRKAATLTPGLVKDALACRFRNLEAFRLVPTPRGKSGPVRGTGPPERAAAA